MDENLLLLDFRLLVDRAAEILGKLSTDHRIEAVKYGLATVKAKYPDLFEQIRREYCGNESGTSRGALLAKAEDEHIWDAVQRSRVASEVLSKADLNQNFEKIMCKEEMKFDDDDFDDHILACGSSATRLTNNSDDCSSNARLDLMRMRFPDESQCNSLFPATTSDASLSSFSMIPSYGSMERLKKLSQKLQNLLTGRFPTHLPWKWDLRKFSFYTHDFFTQFLRRDEDFNRNAFRQQILAALEFAVDHRKPFLRNFLIKLVLSGVIIPGVRPPPRQIEGISQSEVSNSVSRPENSVSLLSSSCNGVVKEFMDLEESSVTEETTQNTDSSEETARIEAGSPLNSIQAEVPKDKENGVASQNARKPKDKQTYQCLLCPKTYRKRKSLIDHYKMHPGYCHDCGRPNGTVLEEIIEHNRSYHADDFPFICELCGESYSRRQQFHAHVEAHNKKDVKSYSCGECGMEFPRKKLHRQHLEETGHKPDGAICEVCGAGFNSKIGLCQHMNRVHKKDNSFECHICHNRFTMKANLERHVQLHTEIKRTYVCDQCGSSYFTYPALREHFSNAHTDVSECKCTLCGKTFSSVKSLQRHLPSHSEERPHTCNICTQTFKWKTHLVRHKQTVHGNQPMPKKLKRFAKCDEELVPVDIPPPPAKASRKSNSKPKATSTAATAKASGGASTKSKTSTPSSTPTTPQLESQNNFAFPVTENHLTSPTITAPKSNHLIDINSFNAGADNYRFEPTASYTASQQMTMKTEAPQMTSFDGRYQQGSPHAQQQQIHVQSSQHQHLHQAQPHLQQAHHQQPQALHHQQQHLHQHQQPQLLHQAAHHHHQQQQHLSNQILHSQQQSHHQQPQSRMQSPRRHMQSPHGLMQSPQPHMQSPQPHMQSPQSHLQQPQPHMRLTQPQPHHHPQQTHLQQQTQPPHLQHPQSHLQQQQPHLPPPQHQPPSHLPQQQTQPQPNHHTQHVQYTPDWHNINFNAATATSINQRMDSSKEKYFPVIEVTSNDFIGLPMAELPKSEHQQQQPMDTAELLSFQNMWPGNNQQMNFNNGNIESNTYNNIGSILTNLELIGNNSSMDFNNYDIMSEHQMGTQQLQHHAYIHQDIDPNSGNINHPVINYDYNSQNHTITDLSNTMQNQKNDFQYHQASNFDPSVATGSGGVFNQNENDKVILPPLTDYMHQATMQQQQQQQQQGDVNIVYYPVKN